MSLLPKQRAAWDAMFTHRYILFGGARGPGKSYLLRWAALTYLIYLAHKEGVKGARVGLFCETYPDLRDRQISKIKVEFPLWLGEVKETKEDGLCFFVREEYGGGIIALRNLDDPTKYQSAEFASIFVDELTKISKETFDILRGSLRWAGVRHTVFMGASNPGGIGHMWVKQLWLDRAFPAELEARANEFIFIRALPADNPHLDASYWAELDSLPEPLRSAWRDGNWDIFAGMAFPLWDRNRHVIEPETIPEHWARWRGLDWGYAAPFCCLWCAKDPDSGRVYVYREVYARELTDRQQARLIQDNTPQSERVNLTYADPSMWSKKNALGVVTSTADEYLHERVVLTQADNDRLAGKRKVDRMLANLPDGKPGLQVFSTCVNLVRSLPALPRSERNPEDVDTDADDHAYDALRYALTNIRPPSPDTRKAGRELTLADIPIL